MAWNLPPLAAIRVFEATARLGSFTRAAEELGMTQAAASYQIKVLEERLGAPLFVRKARQISLTQTGERLSLRTTEAFSLLSEAWVSAKGGAAGMLSISTVPSFASNWLALRLGSFQLMHPGLAVKLDASPRLVDFTREDMDVGIRTGVGTWSGVMTHYLFKADYMPMLSPALAESVGGIREPNDLLKLPLLSSDDPWWTNWFRAAGAPLDRDRVKPGPSLGGQAYEATAAMAGQGVAILTKNLYETILAEGRLIQPFDIFGSDGDGYWLVYAETRRNVPKIKAFRDWILAETAAIRDLEVA